MLVDTDRGIAVLRALTSSRSIGLAGLDPLGAVRSPEENELIELPQERNKYGRGREFLPTPSR